MPVQPRQIPPAPQEVAAPLPFQRGCVVASGSPLLCKRTLGRTKVDAEQTLNGPQQVLFCSVVGYEALQDSLKREVI